MAGQGLVGRVRTEFAVIGAGLWGLSAAWALRQRGHEVLVLDQGEVGHVEGGSHGSCRIFRLGYEDPAYVTLAARARDSWTELEEAAGEQLLVPVPQLTFGPQLDEVRAAMEQAGQPGELLSAAEAAERFPGVAVTGEVLFESASAVTLADRALAALARLIGPAGLLTGGEAGRVTSLTATSSGVRVSTSAGEVDAERVIVCAGPWTARLVAGLGITVPGSASLEQVAYVRPAQPGLLPAVMPILVHYGGEFPYGLPVPGSDRYKIGIHFGGPPVNPENQDQSADTDLGKRIEAAAKRFLPAFDPRPVAVERCIYDNSPDTDFIIDQFGPVVLGCGTSGHGFKFGPLIGGWLADLAGSGAAAAAPAARFALGRFRPLQSRYGRRRADCLSQVRWLAALEHDDDVARRRRARRMDGRGRIRHLASRRWPAGRGRAPACAAVPA
jgi:sarcosine oxidase